MNQQEKEALRQEIINQIKDNNRRIAELNESLPDSEKINLDEINAVGELTINNEFEEIRRYAIKAANDIFDGKNIYTHYRKYLYSAKLIDDGQGNKKTEIQIYEEEFKKELEIYFFKECEREGNNFNWKDTNKFLGCLKLKRNLVTIIINNLFEETIKLCALSGEKTHDKIHNSMKNVSEFIKNNNYNVDKFISNENDVRSIFMKHFYVLQHSKKTRLKPSDKIIINYLKGGKSIFMDIGIAAGKSTSPFMTEEEVAIATRVLAKKMTKECPNAKIIGVDITTDGLVPILQKVLKTGKDHYIKFIAPNLKYKKCDATQRLPAKENSIDIIRAAYVFMHLNNEQIKRILKNVIYCLKPKGIFITQTGHSPELNIKDSSYIIIEKYEKNNSNLKHIETIKIDGSTQKKEILSDSINLKNFIAEIENEGELAPQQINQIKKHIITLLQEKQELEKQLMEGNKSI
ncbi:MAG: class I SAM-dependent methyltransferase [Candidatus Aenigmarchaeota archaeon]|nr:class I SAM-dependent methyltransferase [Candidatus Aenigmarchaeota archaeon]